MEIAFCLFPNPVSENLEAGILFYALWSSGLGYSPLRWSPLFANEDWILGFDLGFPKVKFLSNSRCLAQLKSGWDWEILSWGGSVLWTVQMDSQSVVKKRRFQHRTLVAVGVSVEDGGREWSRSFSLCFQV